MRDYLEAISGGVLVYDGGMGATADRLEVVAHRLSLTAARARPRGRRGCRRPSRATAPARFELAGGRYGRRPRIPFRTFLYANRPVAVDICTKACRVTTCMGGCMRAWRVDRCTRRSLRKGGALGRSARDKGIDAWN